MKLCYHCMSQISNDKASFCPECGKSLEPEQQKPRFLKAGTVLGGKFLAGCPLGAGGFGNTYIGWDQMLQRKVAIKEFYPEQYCGRGQDGLTVILHAWLPPFPFLNPGSRRSSSLRAVPAS